MTHPSQDTPGAVCKTCIAPDFPVRDADRCVLCGMCLAHCPTYLTYREEGESPRGRIALLTALAAGELTPSPRLRAHLDHCLVCRACERICPSGVPYGRLIDAGRALVIRVERPPLTTRLVRRLLLNGLIAHPQWLQRLGWVLYALQRTRFIRPLASLVGWKRLARRLPLLSAPSAFRRHYPARGTERGCVALFTGCVTRPMDRVTLDAAVQVLTGLGYRVEVPPRQGCCGALHLHNGDPLGAQRLEQHNKTVFAVPEPHWDAILTIASGCGATLAEYSTQDQEPGSSGPALGRPVMDISDFLARYPWPEDIVLRPLQQRVAVHDPCSLVNVLRQTQGPYQLLRRIPGLTVLALLTESSLTRRLQSDKIAALRKMAPDILVSSNLGCALHLAEGLREAGLSIEVLHPVTLIARQIS